MDTDCFFLTGTGRCGTMLLARMLSAANDAHCDHEKCFRHSSFMSFHQHGDATGFEQDIHYRLKPQIAQHRRLGKLYGVSSAHLCFAIPQLYQQFGDRARFILMVRRPEDFARSALARGFFDPDHPHYCDQLQPHADDPIHARWRDSSPLERCLWYWQTVNGWVLDRFAQWPQQSWRVVRMEELSVPVVADLCRWLGIEGLSEATIAANLSRPVNTSPVNDQARAAHDNPRSHAITLPPVQTWSPAQRSLLDRYTQPLRDQLYPPRAMALAS